MTNSKTKILNEFLINQSVIDLLIDKGVFTEEELKDSLEGMESATIIETKEIKDESS